MSCLHTSCQLYVGEVRITFHIFFDGKCFKSLFRIVNRKILYYQKHTCFKFIAYLNCYVISKLLHVLNSCNAKPLGKIILNFSSQELICVMFITTISIIIKILCNGYALVIKYLVSIVSTRFLCKIIAFMLIAFYNSFTAYLLNFSFKLHSGKEFMIYFQ